MRPAKEAIIKKIGEKPMSINDLNTIIGLHQAYIRQIISELQQEGRLTVIGKTDSKKFRGHKINIYGIRENNRR